MVKEKGREIVQQIKKISISLIIPTYGRPRELENCLRSIKKSAGLDREFKAEIILIDDTPNQRVVNLFNKYRRILPLILIRSQKHLGIAEKKNLGIAKAKNEFLFFLDSDIYLRKNTLLKTIETFRKVPAAGMVAGKNYWWGTKNLDRPMKEDRILKYNGINFIEVLYGRYVACYKSLIQKVKGFDNNLFAFRGEGGDISTKFWRAGYPLVYNPFIVTDHVRHASDSITRAHPFKDIFLFRTFVMYAYKYQKRLIDDDWFAWRILWLSKMRFGQKAPLIILDAFNQSVDWIKDNYHLLLKSRKEVPKLFDFAPTLTYSKLGLMKKCIITAPERIASAYNKVFNE